MGTPEIQLNARTSLRLLTGEDAEAFFTLADSCRPHLRRWVPWVENMHDVADAAGFIAICYAQFEQEKGLMLGIWHDGQFAGVVGYHSIDWRSRNAVVEYWLGEAFVGLGLVTTACRKLIAHAFEAVELNRLEIRCAVGNLKSRAIPERLGFQAEGVLREAEWLHDHFVDHQVYGLLAREWRALQGAPATP